MATSYMESPLQYYSLLQDPYRSPAKRFALRPQQLEKRIQQKTTSVELKERKSSSSVKNSSISDENLMVLLESVPRQEEDPCIDRFHLYQTVVDVYSAINKGLFPSQASVQLDDASFKREVYQMVFDVTYHRNIMEEMLIESGFYSRHFDLHSHELLVLVVLYDFQRSKFTHKLPRSDTIDKLPPTIVKVAQALFHQKVKLSAALARMRVRENAQFLTQLIPNLETRKRYERSLMEPIYARVNILKVTNVRGMVLSKLCDEGFSLVKSTDQLKHHTNAVCLSRNNLLVFSPDCRGCLDNHELVKEGYLIVQDLASYCFVEKLRNILESINGDVILTHTNAGVEAVHIASIVGQGVNVIAYDAHPNRLKLLNGKKHITGVENLQFVNSPFTDTSMEDDHLTQIELIVCLPPSSLSNVAHDVDFVLQEEQQLITVFHNATSSPTNQRIVYSGEQIHCFTHALTFHQASYIVYATRSKKEAENEVIMKESMKRYKAEESTEPKFIPSSLHPNVEEEELNEHAYYTSLFERKSDKSRVPAKEVIANAIARGILSGDGLAQQNTKTSASKRKPRTKRLFSHHDGIPMTVSAQHKIVKKKEPPTPVKKPFL